MSAREQLSGGAILLKALKDQGVDVVFGYPGGVTLPIYDELYKQNHLRHILTRHEQGAMHAAEGYARSTGKVGVVFVTSGPGATNTVTGLVDALMDSIPLVCISGQVPTALIGNDAFQEADTTGITRSATKHNYLVKNIEDLSGALHEAFHVARSGRPGPVLVDMPKDIITGLGTYVPPGKVELKRYKPQVKGDTKSIEKAVKMMMAAKRPLLYCGGGVINSGPGTAQLLKRFAKETGFPVTLTLMGLGAFPASDDQYIGMPGMHGTYEANMAMHDCDLMINLGARFDDRVTGRTDAFSPGSKKIHVDIDPSSINKNIVVDLPIIGDVGHVLEHMMKAWKSAGTGSDEKSLKSWWKKINDWRKKDSLGFTQKGDLAKPQFVLGLLQDQIKGSDAFVSTDVGQHQMWAAQYLRFDHPNRWMTSGGLGTMGYGLPAAMGVQVAHPGKISVLVTSEASLQMNIQELGTIAEHDLPVKILNLNNHSLGMVRQWQEMFYEGRYSESILDTKEPDFIMLAAAYGIKGERIEKSGDVKAAIKKMLAHKGPYFLDVVVDPLQNVYPMIPAGAAHNEMILSPSDAEPVTADENNVVLA